MTTLRKIAIVGRPNVGKSALFNRIIGRRLAIVDEAEGITRDRLVASSDIFGTPFEIVDTGGINEHSQANFNDEIREQAKLAIREADGLIMTVDGTVGITDLDQELANYLLRTNKPVVLAVNKVDSNLQEHLVNEFYSLGFSHVFGVSALHNFNVAELLETAVEVAVPSQEAPPKTEMKVALIGRPNSGKSTLLNNLLNEKRCIVSPIPGTTRDSVDVCITSPDGKKYTFVDTAGIRRKKAEHEVVDKFAAIRTKRAIEYSDIVVLLLDATEGITAQEKKMASMIQEEGKPCLVFFNKWDLVADHRMEHCLKNFRDNVPFLAHCPTSFGSALTGRNLLKLFPDIEDVYAQSNRRITTGELNKFLSQQIQLTPPPMITGKRLRVYYATQVKTTPPTFTLFVNYRRLMTKTYMRFLNNRFRETFGFQGTPIFFYMKEKKNKTYDSASSQNANKASPEFVHIGQ